MPTDPLTGSRYPASTAAPNVPQDIQNAVLDLAGNTVPRFATTTARDSAYSAYVAAGEAVADGMHCWVTGIGGMVRADGAWVGSASRGVVGAGEQSSAQSSSTSTEARITGTTNVVVNLSVGRAYRAHWSCTVGTDTVPTTIVIHVRGAKAATPTSASTLVAGGPYVFTGTGGPGQALLDFSDLFTVATAGSYNLSGFIARGSGSGIVSVTSGPSHLEVEDVGPSTGLSGFAQLS